MLESALTIPFWLELAATVAGALFGALSAVRARYDIFGVSCIAIVVGLSGGMVRDILLQNYGIYAFQKPSLILACVGAGVFVFYFSRLLTYFDPVVDLLDNLSVALWAVLGTGKALSAGLDPVPAVILGTVTANGGGIVRDIAMNREPEAFQAGTIYVTAALVGCIAYTAMRLSHVLDAYAGVTCVALVLGLRYAAIAFGWRTRPARDYSDVVTRVAAKPVRAIAQKVARPPKGKVERDRERRRVYRLLRKIWRSPGSTSPLPPIDTEDPNAKTAADAAPSHSRPDGAASALANHGAGESASAPEPPRESGDPAGTGEPQQQSGKVPTPSSGSSDTASTSVAARANRRGESDRVVLSREEMKRHRGDRE